MHRKCGNLKHQEEGGRIILRRMLRKWVMMRWMKLDQYRTRLPALMLALLSLWFLLPECWLIIAEISYLSKKCRCYIVSVSISSSGGARCVSKRAGCGFCGFPKSLNPNTGQLKYKSDVL